MVIGALKPNPNDTILSVTSGGCNSLALATFGVSSIYAIDKKPEQNYLLELKQKAIQNLNYTELIEFLGYAQSSRREDLYRRIASRLSDEARKYWDSNGKAISHGVAHCGKFERYLHVFHRCLLPLIHTHKRVKQLLYPRGLAEQQVYYDTHWNTPRWRLMFRIFFSRFVMSRSGRSPEMFSHSQDISASELYFLRTERALYSGPLRDNFYLSYALLGSQTDLLPYYLHQQKANQAGTFNNLSIYNADILSFLRGMPDASIDKYNLSDIFEPLDIATTNQIFNEILRTAKPRARIIFWNNLVHRDIPQSLKQYFYQDIETEARLREVDRVFFYERFYVYEVREEEDGS